MSPSKVFLPADESDKLSLVMNGKNFGRSVDDGVRLAAVQGQSCPNVTFISATKLTCSGLSAGSFSGGSTYVSLAGDKAILQGDLAFYGTPTHSVSLGNLASTQASTTVVLSATNVGDSAGDIRSIRIGSNSLGLWFPCTGWTISDDATDSSKKAVQCSLAGGGGSGLMVNITTAGGRSSAINSQFSFARPVVQSMSPDLAEPGITAFLIEGENLGNPDLGIVPTNVKLGGQLCGTVELISSSQLNCTDLDVSKSFTTTTVDLTVVNQDVSAPIFQFAGAPIIRSVSPSIGSTDGGQRITIEGEDLGAGLDKIASITIGGRPCTSIVNVTADVKVSCVTPAGVGSVVTLEYKRSSGVRSGGTGLFKYATPLVSSLSPSTVVGGDLSVDFIVNGTNLGNSRDSPALTIGGL